MGLLSHSLLAPLPPGLKVCDDKYGPSQVVGASPQPLLQLTSLFLQLLLPAVLLLGLTGRSLARLILSGQAFGSAEAQAVAALIPASAGAAGLAVLRELWARALYHQGRTSVCLRVSLAMLPLNLVLNGAARAEQWGPQGIVGVMLLVNLTSCALHWSALNASAGWLRLEHLVQGIGKGLAAAASVGSAVAICRWSLTPCLQIGDGRLGALIHLALDGVAALCGIAFYVRMSFRSSQTTRSR
jgi:peptidoglycan biosynthesis protein MviN/MurJ (putative lipid II flippase)